MYSRFLRLLVLLACSATLACSDFHMQEVEAKHYIQPPRQKKYPVSQTALRVCADPNNLPFSNLKGEGFENKIAELVGAEMHLPVEYTWWAQRRGFFRNTLNAGACDLVVGAPAGTERAETTRPYYRSTYVFVSRTDRQLNVSSFDDPRLGELVIGVQIIGDDGLNPPPVHALSKRGIVNNVKGYTVYGDYTLDNPPARIIDAVADGDVDIAVVWGPLAGYFANKQSVPLTVTPISPQSDGSELPIAFDISMGVRQGEDEFRAKVEEILTRRSTDIEGIFDAYNIPRVTKEPDTEGVYAEAE